MNWDEWVFRMAMVGVYQSALRSPSWVSVHVCSLLSTGYTTPADCGVFSLQVCLHVQLHVLC